MLRAIELPRYINGYWWFIGRFTGNLYRSTRVRESAPLSHTKSLIQSLAVCDDPFACAWMSSASPSAQSASSLDAVQRIYRRMRFLRARSFWLAHMYAGIQCPLFDSTHEALSAIGELPEERGDRDASCLTRALVAAKVSRSFTSRGVVLIGALLESEDMHAWIIEDGTQPDPNDRDWVNYRPLLALVDRVP